MGGVIHSTAKPFPETRRKGNILFVGRLRTAEGRGPHGANGKLNRSPGARIILARRSLSGGSPLVRANRGKTCLAGRVSMPTGARHKTAHISAPVDPAGPSDLLIEAMAAGLPVVASDIHGYKRVVQRNVTGLLVEPKDPDAIAGALERLLCEPALRDRLGQAGARRAPEYDWTHVTAQLVELYEEVIRKRGVR